MFIGLKGLLEGFEQLINKLGDKVIDIDTAISQAKTIAEELKDEAEKKAADIYSRILDKVLPYDVIVFLVISIR